MTDPTDREARETRDMMMPESFYQQLDPGIRFAVRVLHAVGGIETCQSCAGSGAFGAGSGKQDGDRHAYLEPTVDLIAGGGDATGFAALAALHAYGLPVARVALVWNIQNGLPFEKLWRITFFKTMEERADDRPMFIYGYRAMEPRHV